MLGYDAPVWSSPFPPEVGFCALEAHVLDSDGPHPEELAQLSAGAVVKRRREFSLGRVAARRAMEAIGHSPTPLLIGHNREPRWPETLRGSISHAAGWGAAAVAPASAVLNLGLDLEDSRSIRPGIEEAVTDVEERRWTAGDPLKVAMVFSAKESVFKAFHRFRREYFGFEAVHLRWQGAGFEVTLREAMGVDWPVGARVEVGCVRQGPLVLSSLLLRAG